MPASPSHLHLVGSEVFPRNESQAALCSAPPHVKHFKGAWTWHQSCGCGRALRFCGKGCREESGLEENRKRAVASVAKGGSVTVFSGSAVSVTFFDASMPYPWLCSLCRFMATTRNNFLRRSSMCRSPRQRPAPVPLRTARRRTIILNVKVMGVQRRGVLRDPFPSTIVLLAPSKHIKDPSNAWVGAVLPPHPPSKLGAS